MASRLKDSALAFDTSSACFSAALFHNGKMKETERKFDLRHSEDMFVRLGRFLRSHSCPWSKIGLVAVGLGPGSFTGLRIGITAAKTMAYALGAELCGVSSMEVIARNYTDAGTIGVVRDARRGNVYAALYEKVLTVEPPRLMTSGEFEESRRPGVTYVGSFPWASVERYPRARNLIRIALERRSEGTLDDPFTLDPAYLYSRECTVTLPK